MTNEQAKNGFKTFIITLSVSLIVFSALYYLINVSVSRKVDIEQNESVVGSVLPASTEAKVETPKKETVFGPIANTKVASQPKVVLAGSTTQTTQSTTPVPVTGSTEMTYALLISSVIISLGTFMYLAGPRKAAIASFEKDVLKSFEDK